MATTPLVIRAWSLLSRVNTLSEDLLSEDLDSNKVCSRRRRFEITCYLGVRIGEAFTGDDNVTRVFNVLLVFDAEEGFYFNYGAINPMIRKPCLACFTHRFEACPCTAIKFSIATDVLHGLARVTGAMALIVPRIRPPWLVCLLERCLFNSPVHATVFFHNRSSKRWNRITLFIHDTACGLGGVWRSTSKLR